MRKFGMQGAGLLLATTILSGVAAFVPSQVLAQNAAAQRHSFSVAAQPVPQALNAIGRVAGLSIVVNGGAASGVHSQPVAGSLTVREALSAVLAGTGLTYSFTNADTVTVFDPRAGAQTGGYAADGDAVMLETIDVSGGGGSAVAADRPYETPGSVSHVSSEQIQRVPPTSTGDMFRNVPGVMSSGNRNGQSLDLNIRGLQGPNRVATLVDGAQQASSTYRGYRGMSSRTFVDPEFIGGIDVEKGPSSGPFGSGSMGGVVNMRTITADDIVKDGNTYGIKIKGGLAGNTINPPSYALPPNTVPQRFEGNDLLDTSSRMGSIAIGAKSENFELLGAFAYRRNGNYFAGKNGEKLVNRRSFGTTVYRDPMSGYKPGGEVFNTSQDTTSILLKGKVNFNEEHSLELGYIRYDSEYGEEYGDLNAPSSAFGQTFQANLSHVTSDTYTAKYNWSPLDNDLIDFHVNVWRTDVSDLWAAFALLTGFPSEADIVTTGTEVWNTSRFDASFGAFELKYGGAYSHEEVTQNPGQLMSVEGTREVGALFANLSYKPADWLTLSGGLRYETYATEDNKAVNPVDGLEDNRLNPRVGVTVEPLDGLQLFATYTEGWRPPSVRETVFVMPTQIDPNPFLRPEISKNYEFGFNYLHEGLFADGDKIRLKTAYFDNTYEDYIIREYGNRVGLPWSYRTFANIEGAKFKGVEVSLSYDMGRFFTEGSVSYYTDVEYCFASAAGRAASCVEDTPSYDYTSNYVPPKYNGSLTIGGRFLDESLTVGGRVTFAGDRAILRKTGVESNWRPYQVYDAFVNYEVNENFSIHASLENAFDLYYLDALSEALSPSPGRTLRVSATAKF